MMVYGNGYKFPRKLSNHSGESQRSECSQYKKQKELTRACEKRDMSKCTAGSALEAEIARWKNRDG